MKERREKWGKERKWRKESKRKNRCSTRREMLEQGRRERIRNREESLCLCVCCHGNHEDDNCSYNLIRKQQLVWEFFTASTIMNPPQPNITNIQDDERDFKDDDKDPYMCFLPSSMSLCSSASSPPASLPPAACCPCLLPPHILSSSLCFPRFWGPRSEDQSKSCIWTCRALRGSNGEDTGPRYIRGGNQTPAERWWI